MEEQHIRTEDNGDLLSAFDFQKFKVILRKSWWFILILIIAGVSTAYLYIRYTKPVFESSSIVKLDIASDASILNISSPAVNQTWGLQGEIELLRSSLFFDKVADVVDLDVSYYKVGRVLDDERYLTSPFKVDYRILNSRIYNRSLEVKLTDEGIKLPWIDKKKIFRFDEVIKTEDLEFSIKKTPLFNGELLGDYYFILRTRNSVINYIKSHVNVLPESFPAKTLRITFQEHNRRKAQDLIKAIDSIYIEYSKEAKNQTMQQKIAFLDERIKDTEEKMIDFESYFQDFIIHYRTTSLNENIDQTLIQLNILDSALSESQREQISIELLIDELKVEEPEILNSVFLEQFPDLVSSAVLSYMKKLNERKTALRTYSENSYAVKRLNASIIEQKETLLITLDAYLDKIKNRRKNIVYRLSVLEGSLYKLPGLQNEYSKMRRSYGQQSDFMNSLLKAKMEIEITLAGTTADIIILSPANFPTAPIKPQKTLIYAFSIAGGLFLSVFFVLIRYLLNDKITSVRELERLINVPILGSVPQYRQEKLPVTKLVMTKGSKSSLSESLRTIRTNMEFINPYSSQQIISVTSTVSGEGKTFLGVNLGAIVAMSGKKVCIVDMDMRKPKVHLAFGGEKKAEGVSTVLAKKTELLSGIQKSHLENLNYLPAGPTPPNPSELIIGSGFDDLLTELKEHFDTIILDTPPVGLVTDGILVMKKTNLQMYVVRAGYSKRSYVKTIESLKKTDMFRALSVVFNSVSSSTGYPYGYGYGYGYGHGHGYYEEPEGNGILDAIKSKS